MERLRNETVLLAAKTAQLDSGRRAEDLFALALAALHAYRGEDEENV